MADLSKIALPSGTTYDLKDAKARQDIEDIKSSVSSPMRFLGTTTTPLSDGSTATSVVIGGESMNAMAGDIVLYGDYEFIYGKGDNKWHQFGTNGTFKALAFKDSASGDYTPEGSVSQPTFTGTAATISVDVTAEGSVSISTGSGTANYTPAGTVSKPTFSGLEGNVSVTGTPSGGVTITKGNGTANYTPEGSISVTPDVQLNTATVNSITAVGTLPTCTLPEFTATVSGETLTLGWADGSFTQGTLPTKGSDVTVATGIKSQTASGTFTGTGAELKATFTGESMTATGKFTPAGNVSQPTFSGTGVDLEATFTGDEVTASASYTPTGTVSKPTFTGTQETITVS